MKKIQLVSDSTCDLNPLLVKNLDLVVIPLGVNLNDKTYLDGVDLIPKEMYKIVEEIQEFPKTNAATPNAFYEAFKKALDQNMAVFYTGLGSGFSKTFENAHLAKGLLEEDGYDVSDIVLVDSKNLSGGSGLLLLKADSFRSQGLNAHEIEIKINEIIPRVRVQFVIDTLNFLHLGGRVSGMANFVGSLLNIHPIIKVRDNKMEIGQKPRGKLKKGLDILASEFNKMKEQGYIDEEFMFITHTESFEALNYLHDKIDPLIKPIPLTTEAGCVISSHCGPRSIGTLYILNENYKEDDQE